MYFGASLGVTAGTAVAIFRSPAMMNIPTIPCLATMFIIAGDRKMATAVPAVTPRDAPKYV